MHASLDHGAAREVESLAIGQRDLARTMHARSEIDDVGIPGPRHIGFRRISKQEQRLLPAVPFYGDPKGGLRRKCNLAVAAAFEPHLEATGLHLSLGQRLARCHANDHSPREVKRREAVVPSEEFALRGIHIDRLAVYRDGIIAGNRLPCRRRIDYDVCTNERGNEYRHKAKPDHRTSQNRNRVVHCESSVVGGPHPYVFQPHSYLRVAAKPHRGVDGFLRNQAVIVGRRVEYPFIASGRTPIGTTAAAGLRSSPSVRNSAPSSSSRRSPLPGTSRWDRFLQVGRSGTHPPPRRKTIAKPAFRSGRWHCHAHHTSSPAPVSSVS